MPLELWIPESARPEPRRVFKCTVCGLELPREQRAQFQRHARACASKNEDVIREATAKHFDNAFMSPLDPERHDWIREREERKEKVNYLKDGVVR